MKLIFVSVNNFKAKEVKAYLDGSGIELSIAPKKIQEIMHIDLAAIVKDKLLQAYRAVMQPCVVEHGGLYIDSLGGLPGGLSKVVWDTVGEDLCRWLPAGDSSVATARSIVGYCDGKKLHILKGETRGRIANTARGAYTFQWDPIFIPDGTDQTNAEMGFPGKQQFSQAAKAWAQLKSLIEPGP